MSKTREFPAPARPSGHGRGFTILELLIVLVVVTVAAAVSIWAYFARPAVTLENAVLLLARDMQVAQSRASLLQRPVYLFFREGGDGYRVVDSMNDAHRSSFGLERIERRFSRDAIFEGVRILPFGLGAEQRIVFPGDGSRPTAGHITLSYQSEIRSLEIEAGTGRVLVARSPITTAETGP